jgi:hypothetical protein
MLSSPAQLSNLGDALVRLRDRVPRPPVQAVIVAAGWDRPVSRWTVLWAALIPAVLIQAWLISDALQPRAYSPVRETVSVLAGHAGTDRGIMTGALVVVGFLYLLVAAGLAAVQTPARLGLVIAGICGLGIAASPQPAAGATVRHAFFAAVGAVAIAFWPLLAAQSASSRRSMLGMPAGIAASTVFVALSAWTLAETHYGDFLGLAERISISVSAFWPLVIAIAFMAQPREISLADLERRRSALAHIEKFDGSGELEGSACDSH